MPACSPMGGSRLYENEKTFQCVGAGFQEGWWLGVRACVRADMHLLLSATFCRGLGSPERPNRLAVLLPRRKQAHLQIFISKNTNTQTGKYSMTAGIEGFSI